MWASTIRILILCLFLAVFSSQQGSAASTHQWSHSYGSTERGEVRSIAVDGQGNVIIAGSYEGTINFGGDDLLGFTLRSIFLAKFNANGVHLWSLGFESTDFFDKENYVAVGPNGTVFLAGDFYGTTDFGGGPISSPHSATNIYFAAFSPDGLHLASHSFVSTDFASCSGIAVDQWGDVVMAGKFSGTFNCGAGNLMSIGDSDDIFLAYLAPDGYAYRSIQLGGPPDESAGGIAVDQFGDVILTGRFGELVNFGGGDLTSLDGGVFIAKFDWDGVHQWSHGYEATIFQSLGSVVADPQGNVLVGGSFQGDINLGGSTLAGGAEDEVILAKFTAGGAHLWSSSFGGLEDDKCMSIATDFLGNVYMTGSFEATANFGGAPLVSGGGDDIVVAVFDSDGIPQWSQGFGGVGVSDFGYGIAVGGAGNPVVAGVFSETVDFGGGNRVSAGMSDAFVFKYTLDLSPVSGRSPRIAYLHDSYPNPFNPQTMIAFDLPIEQAVSLRVYDVSGRLVDVLVDNEIAAQGRNEVVWRGRDGAGRVVSAGVYFYRLDAGSYSETKRMVLVK